MSCRSLTSHGSCCIPACLSLSGCPRGPVGSGASTSSSGCHGSGSLSQRPAGLNTGESRRFIAPVQERDRNLDGPWKDAGDVTGAIAEWVSWYSPGTTTRESTPPAETFPQQNIESLANKQSPAIIEPEAQPSYPPTKPGASQAQSAQPAGGGESRLLIRRRSSIKSLADQLHFGLDGGAGNLNPVVERPHLGE
jgi:hypothetical protein